MPLEDHDGGCPKRLSRRFFVGGLASLIAGTALAKVVPDSGQTQKVIARALSNIEVTQEAADGALVALAAPTVHNTGAFILTCSDMGRGSKFWDSTDGVRQLQQTVENLARRKDRAVEAVHNGVTVAYYDPRAPYGERSMTKIERLSRSGQGWS
jgi:hypothetical protein